jgi:hypothetical protein
LRSVVLVADPDVRGRLWVVDSLRGGFAVSIPGPGENPLRAVRRLHPDAVLLAVPRGRSGEAERTCRLIKTDSGSPPLVGLLDQWGRVRRPERALSSALADGYIGGRIEAGELVAFTAGLLAGERPVVVHKPPPGLLGRLLR